MDKIIKGILFVSGMALISLGAFQGFYEKIQSSSILFGAGIIVLIFSFLSRFKRFKGLGIEGELWEDKQEEAEQLINNTKENIEKLKNSVSTISEIAYTSLASIGRLNPVPKEYKLSATDKLDKNLKELNFTKEEILEVKHYLNFLITFDLASKLVNEIKLILAKLSTEENKKLTDYPSPTQANDTVYKQLIEDRKSISNEIEKAKLLTDIHAVQGFHDIVEQISSFLSESPYFSDDEIEVFKNENEDRFLDLEHFVKTKKLRRPEVYLKEK